MTNSRFDRTTALAGAISGLWRATAKASEAADELKLFQCREDLLQVELRLLKLHDEVLQQLAPCRPAATRESSLRNRQEQLPF